MTELERRLAETIAWCLPRVVAAVKSRQGRTLLDLPVNAGVLGFLLAPAWVTLGTVAALVGGLTVDVERAPSSGGPDTSETPPSPS